jgi:hypothetical protein
MHCGPNQSCARKETCLSDCADHPSKDFGGGREFTTTTHRVSWQQDEALERSDRIGQLAVWLVLAAAVLAVIFDSIPLGVKP